jgi:putative ABC transport system permease protein
MLAYRTLVLAGVASVLGVVLGFLSATAILGLHALSAAAPGDLAISGAIAVAVGLALTAAGLYLPGRRSLRREVSQERAELRVVPTSAWRRPWLGVAMVAAGGLAEAIALGTGTFDAPRGSVSAGEAVSLPSYLLLAPLAAWGGGTLLAVSVALAAASRLPVPGSARFGPVIWGTLSRSLRRRSRGLAGGILGIALVVAFGTSLAIFTATYDAAKAADSRFVVGAELRVTPDATSGHAHGASFTSTLRVPGVSTVTPVTFKLENSVLIGRYNQDRTDLAAIDPASFARTAPLSDSFFVDSSAAGAMAALRADPRGLLVGSTVADDLSIETGDSVEVVLARGTRNEAVRTFRVVGLFETFPGVPRNVDLVANRSSYTAATGLERADFFLLRIADDSHAGLARAVAALRAGPGSRDPVDIDTTETVLDRDQSSLVALDVRGLVRLDSLYTLLMSAAAIAIFVFGLMLQRRREYLTLRALGMQSREIRALVVAEALLVSVCGIAAGVLVGAAMASLLVHVLRPLFVLDPRLTVPAAAVGGLAALALVTALAAALGASAALRRLRPTELLRDA